MRKHIKASELLAILGKDTKNSEWTVWNRMTEEEQNSAGDYARWQSRLSGNIMQGICKDHDLKCEGVIESNPENGVIPPRAWKISANTRSNGRDSIVIVTQKTGQQLYGWQAPSSLPERQRMRLLATAIAYDVDHVFYGVLVDGYRSELYSYFVDPEEKEEAQKAITEIIRMVVEDDEPAPDYEIDRSAIREGKGAKAEATKESINEIVSELDELMLEAKKLESRLKPIKEEIDKKSTILIHLVSSAGTIDCGDKILSIETTASGKKKLKITPKINSAENLF